MANHTQSMPHFPRSNEVRAIAHLVLHRARARCWKLLVLLFARNDAPYY